MTICTIYDNVIIGAMASQITSITIAYSTVYSGADQRKHQSSASLAFVRGINRGPVNAPHKWPVTRKNDSTWWRHHEFITCYACISSICQQVWDLYELLGDVPVPCRYIITNVWTLTPRRSWKYMWPNPLIPQYTSPISHNAPFCIINVHMRVLTHVC